MKQKNLAHLVGATLVLYACSDAPSYPRDMLVETEFPSLANSKKILSEPAKYTRNSWGMTNQYLTGAIFQLKDDRSFIGRVFYDMIGHIFSNTDYAILKTCWDGSQNWVSEKPLAIFRGNLSSRGTLYTDYNRDGKIDYKIPMAGLTARILAEELNVNLATADSEWRRPDNCPENKKGWVPASAFDNVFKQKEQKSKQN